jgi:hypothetical protein
MVARQSLQRLQTDASRKIAAGGGKQLFKHKPHRKHRWPSIDWPGGGRRLAHLAAWRGFFFKHRHRPTGRSQTDRGGEPASAGSNDNGPLRHDCPCLRIDLAR